MFGCSAAVAEGLADCALWMCTSCPLCCRVCLPVLLRLFAVILTCRLSLPAHLAQSHCVTLRIAAPRCACCCSWHLRAPRPLTFKAARLVWPFHYFTAACQTCFRALTCLLCVAGHTSFSLWVVNMLNRPSAWGFVCLPFLPFHSSRLKLNIVA